MSSRVSCSECRAGYELDGCDAVVGMENILHFQNCSQYEVKIAEKRLQKEIDNALFAYEREVLENTFDILKKSGIPEKEARELTGTILHSE